MVATSFCLIFPKAHLTPKASKEVAFSYDQFLALGRILLHVEADQKDAECKLKYDI